jgi:hypothetical protein
MFREQLTLYRDLVVTPSPPKASASSPRSAAPSISLAPQPHTRYVEPRTPPSQTARSVLRARTRTPRGRRLGHHRPEQGVLSIEDTIAYALEGPPAYPTHREARHATLRGACRATASGRAALAT